MNIVPLQVARVSNQLRSSLLLGTLQGNQYDLLTVQNQISTQKQLNRASDDPAAALGIDRLKRAIEANNQFNKNLNFASSFLNTADTSLSTLSDMILQAKSIASSQVGSSSTADERKAQAQVVDSLLQRTLDLSNYKYQGASVFGGQNGTEAAFVAVGGGYKYNGSQKGQGILTNTGGEIEYTLNGNNVFGGLSSQVVGYKNLSPALTASTRLADLQGATLAGISAGNINLTVGTGTSTVDLSTAATAGDVVNLVNAALLTAGSDASLAIGTNGFVLTGDSLQTVTLADVSAATKTAAQLGLTGTAAPTTTLTGTAVGPRITAITTLASLNGGAGIDPTGIKIINGANSATISLTGLTSVEDLINAINGSGTNVYAEINATADGLNLFNPLSGAPLKIGENGGNTAEQLGIRSFNANTNIADFNYNAGITPSSSQVPGPKGTIRVTKTDGTTFAVTLDGITTPSSLIAAINGASGNGTVTATLNATGNGISLSDTSAGPGNLSVAAASGYVSNGSNLGLFTTGSGPSLTGSNITFSTDDFRVSRRDGSSFTVNLTGATTVQDVLNKINNADGNNNPLNKVTASLASVGNGLEFNDASIGASAFQISGTNSSLVASQLGIQQYASSLTPGQILGQDVNPLQPKGIFSSLAMLRDALLSNDQAGISRAAQLLELDGKQIINARGQVGARVKDLESRKDDVANDQLQLENARSLLEDTDMTAAISRFQLLQTAYEASLKVAQASTNLSLMDFLS